ncbi:MAG: YebC/PmpR family DNA-binding transcriptional regulator [Sedimentisphaerales bacterium]|nr:YebC/PmpR family DNA-binding transcriptional regulator [Sedimentisphaerales bacterium]
MSGHSHWAGIKHKKAAIDAKRGKLWSKVARGIIVAAKTGGGDPDANLSLRYAIDKAREANMPKDTIEKAIKKGTGDLEGVNYEEVLYEGYGNNGVAIMCEVLTDNRNRTAGELRKIFDSKGGSLGASGCVAWIFSKKGLFTVNTADVEEETLMEIALEAGADDIKQVEDSFEITSSVDAYEAVKKALQDNEITVQVAELSQIPSNTITLDEEGSRKILSLMDALEDQDDVQNVYANFDIPEDILRKIESD